MRSTQSQRGATLIISMIMLTVLTVLVVYAIRSGISNLRVAGNMQRQSEALMATQQGIERIVEQIKTSNNLALITAQSMSMTSAGASYTVTTNSLAVAGACIMDVPVPQADLDTSKAADIPCFQGQDFDGAIRADGSMTAAPSACKQQTWEIQASVNDNASGTQLTQVQGLAIRVPATMSCP